MSPRSMVTPGGSGRVVFLPRFSTNSSISLSTANREQAELMTPLPPMNNTLSFAIPPTLVRAALDACPGVGFQERALRARGSRCSSLGQATQIGVARRATLSEMPELLTLSWII
jgi:hypothetical protein